MFFAIKRDEDKLMMERFRVRTRSGTRFCLATFPFSSAVGMSQVTQAMYVRESCINYSDVAITPAP